MRRVLAVVLALAGFVVLPARANAWISGCSASASGPYYSAYCASGNARYFSHAYCYKSGYPLSSDYGEYVWPGTISHGSCASGWVATSPGWTQ